MFCKIVQSTRCILKHRESASGKPGFEPNFSQQWCGDGTNYNNLNMNTLSTSERFQH
ncbi:hypothetical protein [Psychroflexus halocasei]|uniref:hypothetical protein n=1 Tax=Psychroflexus halocasei TaxID=908615 RepID=UPI0013565570|nr:hypothetical protein [Psychroflexus halocasei]